MYYFTFTGSNLIFNVSNKTLFELPLAKAIGANKAGKNEVSINFVDPGQPAPEGVNPKEVDELMDVTFYIPGTIAKDNVDEVDDGEEEVNADMVFYDTVKSKLEFSQMTTENIVQFQEVLCLTPRYIFIYIRNNQKLLSSFILLIIKYMLILFLLFMIVVVTILICIKTFYDYVVKPMITKSFIPTLSSYSYYLNLMKSMYYLL